MIQINGLTEGLELFKTLGSEVRMHIVELLSENGEMNLNEIAGALGLTNGALTSHIRKLEECGVIRVVQENTGHGNQKRCSLNVDQILLNVHPAEENANVKVYESDIPIGHYSDYQVHASCGLAGQERLIGEPDDPRFFSSPQRLETQMLWFHDGYVEYIIPNLLPPGQKIMQLTLSFEISSAELGLPGGRPSNIRFFLNGRQIGFWNSFMDRELPRGMYTPRWWDRMELSRGYLKMLVINPLGTYLDGVRISDCSLADWEMNDRSELRFRFETRPEEGAEGGLALYGNEFGIYKQNILARIHYTPI